MEKIYRDECYDSGAVIFQKCRDAAYEEVLDSSPEGTGLFLCLFLPLYCVTINPFRVKHPVFVCTESQIL